MINPLDHPGLFVPNGYQKTSDETWDYNCIAWAAADKENWWWPDGYTAMGKLAYWPKKAPKKVTLKAFTLAFKTLKYEKCQNGDLEKGYEKIAIFALNNIPTHAARQLPNGNWTHKMGPGVDLESSLSAVEGRVYGIAVRYMRRKLRR